MPLTRELLAIYLVAGFGPPGCAVHRVISGQVVDRNGEPLDKVIVSLSPGDVELVTDSEGNFSIDYLRDDQGNRVKLDKRTEYHLEAFRTGYNVAKLDFYFKRGQLQLDPITLSEDTIRVEASSDDIDPARYPDQTSSSGANYEGE